MANKHPAVLLSILFACAPAGAQPMWTSEARSVNANVYANAGTNGDSQSSGGHLLPFEGSIGPVASGPCSFDGMEYGESSATAAVTQQSSFTERGLIAVGSAAIYLSESNQNVVCGSSGDASSVGTVEFTLGAGSAFTLTYNLVSVIGAASVDLYHRDSDTYVFILAATSQGTLADVIVGDLPAGRYLLSWGASVATQTGGPANVTTSYDFNLQIGGAGPCIGDFNQDGGVDGADVEAFFVPWQEGDAAADVNGDGGVDGADVETFFLAWQAGGC
ncbi:MAG: hypothetical protein JSR77_13510 [Planctomycetes bacterium]|nr:hypothetical protein [Planctomycetota bacterium]